MAPNAPESKVRPPHPRRPEAANCTVGIGTSSTSMGSSNAAAHTREPVHGRLRTHTTGMRTSTPAARSPPTIGRIGGPLRVRRRRLTYMFRPEQEACRRLTPNLLARRLPKSPRTSMSSQGQHPPAPAPSSCGTRMRRAASTAYRSGPSLRGSRTTDRGRSVEPMDVRERPGILQLAEDGSRPLGEGGRRAARRLRSRWNSRWGTTACGSWQPVGRGRVPGSP